MPVERYATIAEVRAEGAPFNDDTTYDDDWVQSKIDLASGQIEKFCGHWFASKSRTVRIDGNRRKTLTVPLPIVQIDTITIISPTRFGSTTTYGVDLTEVQVYNRHLTQGVVSPDDRKNPGIAVESFLAEPLDDTDRWPDGDQNIILEGKFGWTELAYGVDPAETSPGSQIPANEGVTPPEIKRACMLLVRQSFPQLGDYSGSLSTGAIKGVRTMKARDQAVEFGSGRTGGEDAGLKYVGGTTGDENVDRILLGFRRVPPMMWA
jgi:hypothetical protein